jgi:hypothetical protein
VRAIFDWEFFPVILFILLILSKISVMEIRVEVKDLCARLEWGAVAD